MSLQAVEGNFVTFVFTGVGVEYRDYKRACRDSGSKEAECVCVAGGGGGDDIIVHILRIQL